MQDPVQEKKKAEQDLIKLGQQKLAILDEIKLAKNILQECKEDIQAKFKAEEDALMEREQLVQTQTLQLEKELQHLHTFFTADYPEEEQLKVKEIELSRRDDAISTRETNIERTIQEAQEIIAKLRGTL